MSDNPLHRIMNPSSIAIVGASNNPMKMGTIQCLNLIKSGFPGEVLPVNPDEEIVLGKKAYPSVLDLPYAPDLAMLVIPSRWLPETIEKFGKSGTRNAVIISAGFKETGDEGREKEQEVVRIAERWGMRFLGPNCLGIVNTHLPFNMTVMPTHTRKGKLSLASQSGTYVAQTLPYLRRHGIAMNKAISVGNEANIDIVDCLEYLGEDETTTAISLYIEGIRRADRFLEVAREVSRKKPVLAQYVGGTEAGARSGSSHTGAMAGPDYVYDGLFEQAGVIRVDSIEDVFNVGWALASQPPLQGRRIGILTNSGGPGTAIANTCNTLGLDVPEYSEEIQEAVKPLLPGSHASAKNPIDLTFHVDMTAISEKIPEILLKSPDIDGLIIHGIMDTGFFDDVYPVVSTLVDISKDDFMKMWQVGLDRLFEIQQSFRKPMIISSFFGEEDHAVREFHDHGVPTFDSPEKAARAMGAMYRHYLVRNRGCGRPLVRDDIPEEARAVLGAWAGKALDEFHAKKMLRAYGIPTTEEALVHTLDEARTEAGRIGYPVALKVCDPAILHKTERGLVHLNIENEAALEESFAAIRAEEREAPVLVAEMLRGDREFMAGMSYHPGFPPCIMFGLGGIYTEALKDNAIRLAPLGREDAFSMMDTLKAHALLGTYRGMKAVDKEALASLLVSLGHLALHFPQIREIDLNPIMIVDGKPKVADALFVKE